MDDEFCDHCGEALDVHGDCETYMCRLYAREQAREAAGEARWSE